MFRMKTITIMKVVYDIMAEGTVFQKRCVKHFMENSKTPVDLERELIHFIRVQVETGNLDFSKYIGVWA